MFKKIMIWGISIFIVLGVIGMNLNEQDETNDNGKGESTLYKMTHGG